MDGVRSGMGGRWGEGSPIEAEGELKWFEMNVGSQRLRQGRSRDD